MSVLVFGGFFFLLALATYGGCSIIALALEKIEKVSKDKGKKKVML